MLGLLVCVLLLSGVASAAAAADSFSSSAPIGLDRSGGTRNDLTALACPTASRCTAGDIKGQQVTFDPAAPGTPDPTAVDPATGSARSLV